jgi:hypothetical protein
MMPRRQQARTKLEQANQPYWAEQVRVQILAASAWLAHAQGDDDQALEQLRAAAILEDSSGKQVAMENRLYTLRELLADMLLARAIAAAAATAAPGGSRTARRRAGTSRIMANAVRSTT